MRFGNNPITFATIAAVICLLVYIPALTCDFINYDDNVFIVHNPAIQIMDGEFFKWAFTTSYQGWWMPLVWISFAIDYQIWGLNPFGFHLTNILFHAVNTGLVVLIADCILRMRQDPGEEGRGNGCPAILLLAGLLWGLHPINVESVAWAVERKNVLNGIFSLGCVLSYLNYLIRKDACAKRAGGVRLYLLSLFLLLLALMTKPVSVVIPVILMVLDWFPLMRLRNGKFLSVLAEKMPYLILSAVITIATLYLAAGQSVLVPLSTYPLMSRFISSGAALFDYCMLILYPVEIIAMYLIPNPLPVSYSVKTAVVICITIFCLYSVGKRSWLTTNWLCFVLPLLPTLHLFINGAHSICSHFAYLPSVAPCIAITAMASHTCRKPVSFTSKFSCVLITTVIAVLLVFYIVITERLIGSWKNPETLWSRVIDIRPVGRAYFYRALYLVEKQRYQEAAADLQVSIQMALSAGYPKVYELYALRGDALYRTGRYEEALVTFTSAITLNPLPSYFYHRGLVFKVMGKNKEAAEDFHSAGNKTAPLVYQK